MDSIRMYFFTLSFFTLKEDQRHPSGLDLLTRLEHFCGKSKKGELVKYAFVFIFFLLFCALIYSIFSCIFFCKMSYEKKSETVIINQKTKWVNQST